MKMTMKPPMRNNVTDNVTEDLDEDDDGTATDGIKSDAIAQWSSLSNIQKVNVIQVGDLGGFLGRKSKKLPNQRFTLDSFRYVDSAVNSCDEDNYETANDSSKDEEDSEDEPTSTVPGVNSWRGSISTPTSFFNVRRQTCHITMWPHDQQENAETAIKTIYARMRNREWISPEEWEEALKVVKTDIENKAVALRLGNCQVRLQENVNLSSYEVRRNVPTALRD